MHLPAMTYTAAWSSDGRIVIPRDTLEKILRYQEDVMCDSHLGGEILRESFRHINNHIMTSFDEGRKQVSENAD